MHQIHITTPDPNTTVCANFTAYGTSDLSYAVVGTMTNQNTDNVYGGTTLSGPPGSQSWSIKFTSLPMGPYVLDVYDTQGNQQTESLTVGKVACN